MEQILIRPATLDDLAGLLRFEQGVIAAERPFDSTLKDDPVYYYDIENMIASSTIELIIAEINGEIVGSGYARIENARQFLKYLQHAYLGFMYVVPEHRGKGINKKIVDALVSWAASKKITEFRLEVYYGNEPAIKAYEKAGFSRHMVEMRMGLDK